MTQLESTGISELFSLRGKHALVVGGAGFLGSAAALGLAELGASVTIASRSLSECLKRTNNLPVSENSRHRALYIDVSNHDAVLNCRNEFQKYSSQLHVLVNAGWNGIKSGWSNATEESFFNDLNINLLGLFRTIKAFEPLLTPGDSSVINFGSVYGIVAPDFSIYPDGQLTNPPGYGAAKAGVIQLTRYLASALAPKGVRVNCLTPGPFPFRETQIANPQFAENLRNKTMLRNLGAPQDIIGAIAFLASPASNFVTGANLIVDGGWSQW